MAFLTEEDEEEEEEAAPAPQVGEDGLPIAGASEENQEILQELNEEDKKGKKKKKDKKDKKGKKAAVPARGGDADDEEGAPAVAAKKKKKPKKEKEPVEEIPEKIDPKKKITRKRVMAVILFCLTITVVLALLATYVPGHLQKQNGLMAYDLGNYEEAYDLLYGAHLNEEEERILQKSTLILQMQRKWDSYENFKKMDAEPAYALDALMQGVVLYESIYDEAQEYLVADKVDEIYRQILAELSSAYGLTESQAQTINAIEDDVTYTRYLYAIADGMSYQDADALYSQPEAADDAETETAGSDGEETDEAEADGAGEVLADVLPAEEQELLQE